MRKLQIQICDWCGVKGRVRLTRALARTQPRLPSLCPECFEKRNELDYQELLKRMFKKDKIFEIMKVGFIAQYIEAVK